MLTGFSWVGTHSPDTPNYELWKAGKGAHWGRFTPIPAPNPPIKEMWKPTDLQIKTEIANPENVVMLCVTHGGPNSLLIPDDYVSTEEVEDIMQHRRPFRFVILDACSSADGGLPVAFTKGLGNGTVCLACTGATASHVTDKRVDDFITLASDLANQGRTIYSIWEELMADVEPNTPTSRDDPRFYGDKNMRLCDIFVLLGDVNGDGKVDSADLQLIAQHIVHITTLTGDRFDRADVDRDGKVTVRDMQLVAQMIVKRIFSKVGSKLTSITRLKR